MQYLLEQFFAGFWHFCAAFCILSTVLYFLVNGIIRIWTRLMRCIMVSIHGWPPPHLDADGDWQVKL